MANDRGWYTSVYAAVLDSPEYMALSADAAAVWWALKLCPENNQMGVFPFFKDQVSARSKLALERIQPALTELEKSGWILVEERWVWLRNHLKFDPNYAVENPKHVKGLLSKLSALPNIKLTSSFVKYYKGLGYIPKPYRYGIHTVSIPVTDTETKALTETEAEPDSSVTLVFDHWRTVMDHPEATLSSERRRCIEARLKDGYTTQQLMDAIDGCKASAFHMGANDSRKVYDQITLICRNATKVDDFRAKRLSAPRSPPSTKAQERQDVANAMIRGGMRERRELGAGDGQAAGDITRQGSN